jgi:hypothetical protein
MEVIMKYLRGENVEVGGGVEEGENIEESEA